jgi:hypothetical protein
MSCCLVYVVDHFPKNRFGRSSAAFAGGLLKARSVAVMIRSFFISHNRPWRGCKHAVNHGWAGFQSVDDPVVAPPFASFRDILSLESILAGMIKKASCRKLSETKYYNHSATSCCMTLEPAMALCRHNRPNAPPAAPSSFYSKPNKLPKFNGSNNRLPKRAAASCTLCKTFRYSLGAPRSRMHKSKRRACSIRGPQI